MKRRPPPPELVAMIMSRVLVSVVGGVVGGVVGVVMEWVVSASDIVMMAV